MKVSDIPWITQRLDLRLDGLTSFRAGGDRVGWLREPMRALLRSRWPRLFHEDRSALHLDARLPTEAHRTAALAEVTASLRELGLAPGWRDEHYAVHGESDGERKFTIERATVKRFGIRGRAVHLNGLVRRGRDVAMWVATRSATKQTDPGKLDNLMGGGLRADLGVLDTLAKEAREEAGLSAECVARASPAGILRFEANAEDGLDANHIHVFDLWLDEHERPCNEDGEVERFDLMPLDEVARLVREPDRFTIDAALVALDCIARLEVR